MTMPMIYLGIGNLGEVDSTNNSSLKENSVIKYYLKYCIFEDICNTTSK